MAHSHEPMKILLNKQIAVIVSFCLLAIVFVTSYHSLSQENQRQQQLVDTFNFVPATLLDCSELFSNKSQAASFTMSTDYIRRLADFDKAVNESTTGVDWIEGFTGQQPTEYRVLHYLAGRPNVRRICETGFNLGHSSFNYLTANPDAIVHSFDLGEHEYARSMARYMHSRFPGRFFIHFGDSTKTIPEFLVANRDFSCDLIYVDGGHTYSVALADLLNMALMASVTSNVLVFDDYPTLKAFSRKFGWAWEDVRRWGYVEESVRCSFESKQFQRGFVIGKVVRRPNHAATEASR